MLKAIPNTTDIHLRDYRDQTLRANARRLISRLAVPSSAPRAQLLNALLREVGEEIAKSAGTGVAIAALHREADRLHREASHAGTVPPPPSPPAAA